MARQKNWPPDPYIGLTFYREEDVAVFAGRDDDIDSVCGLLGLGEIRILLLHGMTGCGKSSFLRAGLIPALEEEIAGYEFLRDTRDRPDFVRSTDDPLASLARAIYRFFNTLRLSAAPNLRDQSRRRLRGDESQVSSPNQSFIFDSTLTEAQFILAVATNPHLLLMMLEEIASRRPKTFVVVLDQAEEIVTLKPDSNGNSARAQFFDFLADLSRSRSDLKLIVCFRTEYHGQFYSQLRYGADVGRINDYYLADFTESQLVEAITRPTATTELPELGSPRDRYHFEYEPHLPIEIAKGLLAAGLTGGVLPALQIVCRRLYERAKEGALRGQLVTIDARAYMSLGGLSGQVISYLENALKSAVEEIASVREEINDPVAEIETWLRVLLCLVKSQLNGSPATDVLPEEILVQRVELEGAAIEAQWMFRYLSDERRPILRPVEVTKIATKEVMQCWSLGHDVLASALQAWSDRRKLEQSGVSVAYRTTSVDSNSNGVLYALNTIMPIKAWKTPILRAILFIFGAIPTLQVDMRNLSLIPYFRLIIIRRNRFPYLGEGQGRSELRHDYLLLSGTFNIVWNQCVDVMSDVLSNGLNLFFRWCEGYPGAAPVGPFKKYLATVQFATDYFYASYPSATSSDVKAAHRVATALNEFAQHCETIPDDQFDMRYLDFVRSVQGDLGDTYSSFSSPEAT